MPSPPDPPARRPLPPRADRSAEEAAERALTNAHIQFRRGLLPEAEQAIRQILAARPDDAGAQELQGDIRGARNDAAGALEAYQAALKSQPGRPTAEAKLARLILRQAEQQRLKTLGVAYSSSDTVLVRSSLGGQNKRSAAYLVLGTALCPGLGQIISGQYLKGGILAALFLLGLALLALSSHAASPAGHQAFSVFGTVSWIIIGVMAADWLYAVIDSVLTASQTGLDADPEKHGWKV